MTNKASHRSAFAADPKFIERLAKQGIVVQGEARSKPSTLEGALLTSDAVTTDGSKLKENPAISRMRKVREANMMSQNDRASYDPVTNALTVCFPGALLLGLNTMLRLHHAQSTALKATWVKRVQAIRLENPLVYRAWVDSVTYPVIVEEIYISPEANLLDHESVTAACKHILDAFVVNGFIPDDNGKVISQPLPYTERGSASGLVLRFRPSPRPWGYIDDSSILLARSALGA